MLDVPQVLRENTTYGTDQEKARELAAQWEREIRMKIWWQRRVERRYGQ